MSYLFTVTLAESGTTDNVIALRYVILTIGKHMPLSFYDASIPLLVRGLHNLSAVLAKAKAHADARAIEPSVLIGSRLAPDMFPLSRQVQIATDTAKGCAARLGGVEIPSFEDTESTFEELQERIAKTLAFIETIPARQLEDASQREIQLKLRGRDVTFTAQAYLFTFVLPNFYFHITTAYGILRHNGVELGKADYLGNLLG